MKMSKLFNAVAKSATNAGGLILALGVATFGVELVARGLFGSSLIYSDPVQPLMGATLLGGGVAALGALGSRVLDPACSGSEQGTPNQRPLHRLFTSASQAGVLAGAVGTLLGTVAGGAEMLFQLALGSQTLLGFGIGAFALGAAGVVVSCATDRPDRPADIAPEI
jgi:hypothetical protein